MVYDNEVSVFGKDGIDISGQNTSGIVQSLNIDLVNGKNKIVVSAINEHGAESIHEVLDVINTKPVEKPDLYIVYPLAFRNLQHLSII